MVALHEIIGTSRFLVGKKHVQTIPKSFRQLPAPSPIPRSFSEKPEESDWRDLPDFTHQKPRHPDRPPTGAGAAENGKQLGLREESRSGDPGAMGVVLGV